MTKVPNNIIRDNDSYTLIGYHLLPRRLNLPPVCTYALMHLCAYANTIPYFAIPLQLILGLTLRGGTCNPLAFHTIKKPGPLMGPGSYSLVSDD